METETKNERRLRERMEELSYLPNGWDGGNSYRISRSVLKYAYTLLEHIKESKFNDIFVFPISSGGVQVEWFGEGQDFEIDLLPYGEYKAYDLRDGNDDTNGILRFGPDTSPEHVLSWIYRDKEKGRT